MTIERVRIQGYRSLRDVEFSPRSFSVLVGANNAGKSSVAAAIGFLADAYGRGLKNAVEARGGFDAIAWRSAEGPTDAIGFEIEASISQKDVARRLAAPRGSANGTLASQDPGGDAEMVVRHAFSVAGRREGVVSEFFVEAEDIEVCERRGSECARLLSGHRRLDLPVFEFSVDPGVPEANVGFLLGMSGLTELPTLPTDLAVSGFRFFSPIVDAFLDMVAQARIYDLVAANCRLAGFPVAGGDLLPGGWGLPTLVAHLQDKQPESWDRVRQALFQIVPDLDDVQVHREYNNQLSLRFVEAATTRPWTAFEVSDGTVRSLALLAALFDPRHPLILVEEPENSLHPWAVRVFIDACRAASSGGIDKQVVLTTHSPVILGYVHPEDVWVVRRTGGQTLIRRLTDQDPDVVSMWEAGTTDLFGLLDSGWIRENVPGATT